MPEEYPDIETVAPTIGRRPKPLGRPPRGIKYPCTLGVPVTDEMMDEIDARAKAAKIGRAELVRGWLTRYLRRTT